MVEVRQLALAQLKEWIISIESKVNNNSEIYDDKSVKDFKRQLKILKYLQLKLESEENENKN